MGTVLLSDPDERSRFVLKALLEALGHRVVHEVGLEQVAAAVIEPDSPAALRMVRLLRARGPLPVILVSDGRRGPIGLGLHPVAYLTKPAPIGPFVRAVAAAVRQRRRVEGAA